MTYTTEQERIEKKKDKYTTKASVIVGELLVYMDDSKRRLDKEVDYKFKDLADKPAPMNENSVNQILELPLLKIIN